MLNIIKCFFGLHVKIIDKREFLGYDYRSDEHFGTEQYYKFKIEGYCLRCDKRFKGIQQILWPFTYKQPYDINFPKE